MTKSGFQNKIKDLSGFSSFPSLRKYAALPGPSEMKEAIDLQGKVAMSKNRWVRALFFSPKLYEQKYLM